MSATPEVLAEAARQWLERTIVRRPVHIHTCPKGHQWPCPSPYCEDVNTRPRSCPAHGGEFPRDTTEDDFSA